MALREWKIVAGMGMPPLELGMPSERLASELGAVGDVQNSASPGGAPAWRVADAEGQLVIDAHCLPDGRLFTVELWRGPGSDRIRPVTFSGVDLFNGSADEVLSALASAGIAVEEDDPFYPTAAHGQLRFDRNGGPDPDEQGLSSRFESILIVPADYSTRYTRTTFPRQAAP